MEISVQFLLWAAVVVLIMELVLYLIIKERLRACLIPYNRRLWQHVAPAVLVIVLGLLLTYFAYDEGWYAALSWTQIGVFGAMALLFLYHGLIVIFPDREIDRRTWRYYRDHPLR